MASIERQGDAPRPAPHPPAAIERWREEVFEPAVARNPERLERFVTPSGLERRPLYSASELACEDGFEGLPGCYPFTRGIQPTMYRGRFWTMRQYAGFTSARETNRRFRSLLASGQTGLSVAFDLPTQIGYDSDDPLARSEVGRVGVPVNGLWDLEALFEEIPLDEVSTSMTINAT